jgi:hypothetical protein
LDREIKIYRRKICSFNGNILAIGIVNTRAMRHLPPAASLDAKCIERLPSGKTSLRWSGALLECEILMQVWQRAIHFSEMKVATFEASHRRLRPLNSRNELLRNCHL